MRAGVGVVDISPYDVPPGKEVFLAGFRPYYPGGVAKNRPMKGIHDPIYARAIAVEGANGVTTLLMSVDLPGLSWKYINPVRRRLEKELGVPAARIIIASAHIHSAPDGVGYWVTNLKDHNKWYTDRLKEWMFQAGAQAIRTLQPAWMKVVTTTHLACRDARTGALKRGPDCHFPATHDGYAAPGGDRFDLPLIQVDKRDPIVGNTTITAAQFGSLATGETITTLINWHNHPEMAGSENLLLSSDFIHYLRQLVEKRLGGKAVYFTGTLGCQIGTNGDAPAPLWNEDMTRTPGPELVHGGWEKIRSVGYEIGHEAVVALQAAPAVSATEVNVSVATSTIAIRVDNFLHNSFTGSAWTFDVEKPDRMIKDDHACNSRWGCVKTDFSVVTIGELGIVTAPGEIDPAYYWGRPASVADYGSHGKWSFPAMPGWERYVPGRHHAVFGEANSYLSYLLPESDNVGALNFKHPNHYEDFVTIWKGFGDLAGNQMMKMLGSSDHFGGH